MNSVVGPEACWGVMTDTWHLPVMVSEVLQYLAPRPGAVIVDGTAGTGGHGIAIAPRLLPDGRLVAVDRDPDALTLASQRLTEFTPQVACVPGNYRDLPRLLNDLGVRGLDGLLLDLGMSSLQVDRAERGFSFGKPGPLDMRMDPEAAETAADVVNSRSAEELTQLFGVLGEERYAGRIARRIVQARAQEPITTTEQLARIIAGAVPPAARHGRLHPATRCFQALRIAVNDELGALEELLAALPDLLNPGGRAVILTYHSLEDRPVKRAFLDGQRAGVWTVLTKKPVTPSDEEVRTNSRARSAKLRAVVKL